jgi:hypothetical protein
MASPRSFGEHRKSSTPAAARSRTPSLPLSPAPRAAIIRYTSPYSLIVLKGEFNPWAPAGQSFYFDNAAIPGAYRVRGPDYLATGNKVKCEPSRMRLVLAEWLINEPPVHNICCHPEHFVQAQHCVGPPKPFLFVVNFMVPTLGNFVASFSRRPQLPPDTVFDRMLDEFINAPDDDYRNKRFKIIPGVPEGSWIAKKAVGNRPALIGKIATTYHRDELENRWFEVCVDVGSSKVAGAMMGAVKGFAATLTLQLGFLIESQREDELPERMLGGLTICTPQMQPDPQAPPHRAGESSVASLSSSGVGADRQSGLHEGIVAEV